MVIIDGRKFYPFVLFTDAGPVMGLDTRSPTQVEREWIEKYRRSAERAAERDRRTVRAEIKNELAFQRRAQRVDQDSEPVITPEGVGPAEDDVSIADVEPVPAEAFDQDEAVCLCGLPDGYGFASVSASQITGIARAWGRDAVELCDGVAMEWRFGRKKKQGRRSR